MIEYYPILLLTILAYFIGSIPAAVWIGRYFYGLDVREYGSGNAGSTNVYRTLGIKAGIAVQLIDLSKGYLAASLASIFYNDLALFEATNYPLLKLAFGMAAVVGHIFPAFAEFRGGKGINTLLGMMLAIHFWASLACLITFIIVLIISHYVSLGSILGTLTFPLYLIISAIILAKEPNHVLIIFGFIIFMLVVMTHQKNIQRIIRGNESKVSFLQKLKRRRH